MNGYRIREGEWGVGNCHFWTGMLWMLAMAWIEREDKKFTHPHLGIPFRWTSSACFSNHTGYLHLDSLKCNQMIIFKTVVLYTMGYISKISVTSLDVIYNQTNLSLDPQFPKKITSLHTTHEKGDLKRNQTISFLMQQFERRPLRNLDFDR